MIIAVPTPVTKSKEPDLRYVKSAAEIVGKNLKKGAIVVLESTVYPGVTEEIVKPILEAESGMKCRVDFKIGYSPERINPGDKEHTTDRITKIVAGMDDETTERLAKLYGLITKVYKAKDIKTAEAAKVIENIQRDLNTLFLFRKKKTCAKRKNNSFFGKAFFSKERFVIKGSKVLIMGLTYKENVADIRETPVRGIIKELREFGIEIFGFDPLLRREEIEAFDVKSSANLDVKMDCVILAVDHEEFKKIKLKDMKELMNNAPVLIDVRGMFDEEEAKRKGFCYRRL